MEHGQEIKLHPDTYPRAPGFHEWQQRRMEKAVEQDLNPSWGQLVDSEKDNPNEWPGDELAQSEMDPSEGPE